MSSLPTDPKARKGLPIFSGVFRYFPRALRAVAGAANGFVPHSTQPSRRDAIVDMLLEIAVRPSFSPHVLLALNALQLLAHQIRLSNGEREHAEPADTGPFAVLIERYGPALLAVAELSRIGNDQHNPGQPLFWNRAKSTDEYDALLRHLLDREEFDTDGVRHLTKVAWRALAAFEKFLELEEQQAALRKTYPALSNASGMQNEVR